MYLQKIVEHKKQDPSFAEQSQTDWEERLSELAKPRVPFRQNLVQEHSTTPSIIAEMKRASPSKGSFQFQGEVSKQVSAYESGGARACSILTNQKFFQGHLEDLQEARKGTTLPLLRKDFLIAPWEIPQAKCFGADAILLIAAILSDKEMNSYLDYAHRCDLEVLLEIHDDLELERALHLNTAPDAIGINNRDLRSFRVNLGTTERLADRLPKEICCVSESGFSKRDELIRFQGKVDAFLIGESLMKSDHPQQTLETWVKG